MIIQGKYIARKYYHKSGMNTQKEFPTNNNEKYSNLQKVGIFGSGVSLKYRQNKKRTWVNDNDEHLK